MVQTAVRCIGEVAKATIVHELLIEVIHVGVIEVVLARANGAKEAAIVY
jgi:hypothetical protein